MQGRAAGEIISCGTVILAGVVNSNTEHDRNYVLDVDREGPGDVEPDDSPGGLGPTFGAGVVRWRVGQAPHRRRVHDGAARPPGGRRSALAPGWTGVLVPKPAAEATAGLP
jgi:hypothetical protein